MSEIILILITFVSTILYFGVGIYFLMKQKEEINTFEEIVLSLIFIINWPGYLIDEKMLQ